MTPTQREEHLGAYLKRRGMSHIKENPNAAYCPISLTSTPSELRNILASRQKTLIDEVLAPVGITGYDPENAPYSPDNNKTAQSDEICMVDTGKIIGARYFIGHSILPSTGMGVELKTAEFLNRIIVLLTDNNIRDTRMKVLEGLNLGYDHFEKQTPEFIQVLKFLKNYSPGTGLKNGNPILLGFPNNNGSNPVDLEDAVSTTFPKLRYTHRAEIHPVQQAPINLEQFYEFREMVEN